MKGYVYHTLILYLLILNFNGNIFQVITDNSIENKMNEVESDNLILKNNKVLSNDDFEDNLPTSDNIVNTSPEFDGFENALPISDEFEENTNSVETKPKEEKVIFEEPVYDIINSGTIVVRSIGNNLPLDSNVEVWKTSIDNIEEELVIQSTSGPSGKVNLELPEGFYIVKVKESTIQRSNPIYLRVGETYQFTARFNMLQINPYSFNKDTRKSSIELYEYNSNNMVWSSNNVIEDQTIKLWVNPGKYSIFSPDNSVESKDVDASLDIQTALLIYDFKAQGSNQVTKGISLDEVVFGQLDIKVLTSNNMPLQSVTIKWRNSSDYSQTSGSSTNSTGQTFYTLAPGNYDVWAYKDGGTILQIWNYSVSIVGGVATLVEYGFSHIIIYGGGNVYTKLKNGTNENQQFAGRWTDSTRFIANYFVPASIKYTVVVDVISYRDIIPNYREKIVIGTKTNFAPYFSSVTHTGRILAYGNSNVTIKVKDYDLDYPIQFFYYTNVGSVTAPSPYWIVDGVWGVTIRYNAPSFDDFYRLKIGIQDDLGAYNNYTVYLSNRDSSVKFTSKGANDRPLDTYVKAMEVNTGIQHVGGWTSAATGNKTLTIKDGEYYFVWIESNNFNSENFIINATIGIYEFLYIWSELTVNTTAEWDNPLFASIYLYNATFSLTSSIISGSTSNGLVSFILVGFDNYSIKAISINEMWIHSYTTIAGTHLNVSFRFGAIAVYVYDVGNNPLNYYVKLYNYTENVQIAGQWAGSDGIALFQIRPYNNYSVIINTVNELIPNIILPAGIAVVVGNFTNNKPVINSINTDPILEIRIGANGNVNIVVDATDIDPIDKLNYIWSTNVGTISGSGSTITYYAPANLDVYRIEVLVQDQFGGEATASIYVSNQLSTVNVTVTKGNNLVHNSYIKIHRVRDDKLLSGLAGWAGADGIIVFNTVFDDEYYVTSSQGGTTFKEYLNTTNAYYEIQIKWSEFVFNTTTANGLPFGASIYVLDNETRAIITSISTNANTGISIPIILLPGIYDLKSTAHSSIWKDEIQILPNELRTVEFHFAQIAFNVTSGYYNPSDVYTKIKNGTSGVLNSGSWLGNDGYFEYNVAPGNYSGEISVYPVYTKYNLIVNAFDYLMVELKLGTLVVFSNNGVNPLSQTIYIFREGETTSSITSFSTGSDGVGYVHLVPGVYDVRIGSSSWYFSILISPSGRSEIGTRLNTAPVIDLVTATPDRILQNSNTFVTVKVSDIDYDYPTLTLAVAANVGAINNLMANKKFTSTDNFEITFEYNSPSTLSLYMINITLSDGFGGMDKFVLIVSDVLTLVNVKSVRSEQTPQSTSVYFYDHQLGTVKYSATTNAITGEHQFNVKDGWYDIKFQEHNAMWIRSVLVHGGNTYNFNATFGEITVFSTGVGGIPLSSYVKITNKTDGSLVTGGWTITATGKIQFILAPGSYRVEVIEATSIFFDIMVYGGVDSVVGVDVPQFTFIPADLSYQFGATGNTLSWTISDTNPSHYNITRNGEVIFSGPWDGSIITINVDNLPVGTYKYKLWINDTYGLYNHDVVFITVTAPPYPYVPDYLDFTLNFNENITVTWLSTSNSPDWYRIYFKDVLVNQDIWNGSSLSYNIYGLGPGVYNLTLWVNDTLGYTAFDQVIFTILGDPDPIINDYVDFSYKIGATGNIISWTATDNNPNNYEIYNETQLVKSGPWSSGVAITINIDRLSVGRYNFTIVVYDASGNNANDTVFVTVIVDTTAPTIIAVLDFTYEEGSTGNKITWTATDDNPDNYEIYNETQLVQSGPWSSGVAITINIDRLSIGRYNFTIVFFDMYSNSIIDNVYVLVIDSTNPSITNPLDLIYDEGSTGNTIVWTIHDNNPDYYNIYKDNQRVYNGTFVSGDSITINVDGLTIGSYEYKIEVFDISGNVATDIVNVSVNNIDQTTTSTPTTTKTTTPTTLTDGSQSTTSAISSQTRLISSTTSSESDTTTQKTNGVGFLSISTVYIFTSMLFTVISLKIYRRGKSR